MSTEMNHNFLYLVWKDPQTRRNYVVGRLTKGEKYKFEYCEENEEARKTGWTGVESFPEEKVYESETLFPVFSSRLPDPKRRDITKILEKYELDYFDEYELLRKSGARLPIDTYELIDPIFPEEEHIHRNFFVMGIRHVTACKGTNCKLLPEVHEGDFLKFRFEPENPNDPLAICVETQNGEHLGYVPRYYNGGIHDRLQRGISYSCVVTEIDLQQNCSECIKVKLDIPSNGSN